MIHDSGDVDVYVVRGTEESHRESRIILQPGLAPVGGRWAMLAILALSTIVAWLLHWLGLSEANVIMTLLLGVVFISFRYGRWPSIVASFLSVILFDVFFTRPYYTIVVRDTQYLVTFFVMLCVTLVISTLTTHIHRQAEASRIRERRTDALHRLGRKLTGVMGRAFLAAETERVISDVFGCETALLLPDDGKLYPIVDHPASFAASESEIAVAQWVFEHDQPAGRGTDTLPSAQAFYLPLISPKGTLGVLGIKHPDLDHLLLSDSRSLLESFANQVSLALERDRSTMEAQEALIHAKSQELRTALLSSVSHDIRTPLAVIAGASSSLLKADAGDKLPAETRLDLLHTIFEESDRLSRLVENLLRMTQLDSGQMQIEKDWHPVEDVVGSALHRLRHALGERPVKVELPEEMLMGYFDAVLLEQVLVNLLENAVRYTPSGSPIRICAEQAKRGIAVFVQDQGPGIPPGELDSIFHTFQRGSGSKTDTRGAGLGLAICRAIMQVHGGTIGAGNALGGGAVFRLWLPSDETPQPTRRDDTTAEEGR